MPTERLSMRRIRQVLQLHFGVHASARVRPVTLFDEMRRRHPALVGLRVRHPQHGPQREGPGAGGKEEVLDHPIRVEAFFHKK